MSVPTKASSGEKGKRPKVKEKMAATDPLLQSELAKLTQLV